MIEKIHDRFYVLLNFLVMVCLQTALCSLLFLAKGQSGNNVVLPSLFRQCSVILAPVFLILVREKTRHFLPFILGHVLTAAFPLLLPVGTWMERAFTAGICLIYTIASFRLRIPEEDELAPVPKAEFVGLPTAIGVCTAGYLACSYMEYTQGCERIWHLSLLLFFCYLVDTYFSNLFRYVRFNRAGSSHIPVSDIMNRGGFITVIFAGVATIFLWIFGDQERMEAVAAVLRKAVAAILRWILYMVSRLMHGDGEGVPPEVLSQPQNMEFGVAEATKTPWLLLLLIKVLEYVIIIASFLLVLYFVYRFVLSLIQRYYGYTAGKKQGVVMQGDATEIRESLQRERREKKNLYRLPRLGRNNEEKIRASFLKTVKHAPGYMHPGEGAAERDKDRLNELRSRMLQGKTADELLEVLYPEGETEELARLYGKARYGVSCTPQEVKQAAKEAAGLMNHSAR